MKGFLERLRDRHGLPGLVAVVASSTAVLALGAAGRARLDRPAPVPVDSRFHLGSNAKAITATLCACLVARGKLAWHSTPAQVLGVTDAQAALGHVTLEALLRHEAGVPPYTHADADDYVVPQSLGARPSLAAIARWLVRHGAPAPQADAFRYSNAGYALAGAMAEAAAGAPFPAAVEAWVYEPLGVAAPAVGGWPASVDERQPYGHYTLDGESAPHPPDHEYQLDAFLAPAGDLSLSIQEYGAFLRMNLRTLLGSEETFPGAHVRRLHQATADGGWGAGWVLGSAPPFGRHSLHNGSAGTFVAGACVFPELDRVTAVMTNSGDVAAHRECMQAVNRTIVADMPSGGPL